MLEPLPRAARNGRVRMQPDTPGNDRDPGDTATVGDARVADLIGRIDAALAAPAGAATALLRDLRAGLQALQEDVDATHRRYDSLFNAVPDPISVLDAQGRVLELNDAGVRAYRLSLIHISSPRD